MVKKAQNRISKMHIMKKLKCWKKLKDTDRVWNRSGEEGDYPYLFVGRGYINTTEKNWKKRYPFEVGLVHYNSQRTIADNIGTKIKAIEIARKYMEEHDSC